MLNSGGLINYKTTTTPTRTEKRASSQDTIYLAVLPPHKGREADHETEDPQTGDQHFGPRGGHDAGVRYGPRHGHVAVQRDGAQVEDGRGAHPDVQGQPHVAPDVSKYPHLESETT